MNEYVIMTAVVEDEVMLCDMFLEHITANTEYISHGEIQMGVGEGDFVDGKLVARPSSNARHFWTLFSSIDFMFYPCRHNRYNSCFIRN